MNNFYEWELKDFLSVDMFNLMELPKGAGKLSKALQRALKKYLLLSEGSFSAYETMVAGVLGSDKVFKELPESLL